MQDNEILESPFANSKIAPLRRKFVPRSMRRKGRIFQSLQVLGMGILVAFGTMTLLMAISWIRSQAAVAVVKAQVEDIRGGKLDEAYELFSKEYKSGVSIQMFRRFLRRDTRLTKYQSLEFWGRSALGQTAVLWGSMEDKLGRSSPVRYQLVRENGSWKIEGFHISAEIADPNPEPVRFTDI